MSQHGTYLTNEAGDVYARTVDGQVQPVEPESFGWKDPYRPEADYVYVMDFDGEKIRHMTKIWHAGLTMKAFGWI